MTKQEKLNQLKNQLKKQVKKLEEEVKNEPIKQIIPEQKLEWGKLAEEDMDWEEAKEWCKKQGDGWRLPTAVELVQAYYEEILGFGTGIHWSSTEYSDSFARSVNFSDGDVYSNYKALSYAVRCVRGW